MKKIFFSFAQIICLTIVLSADQWSNHDISTLKLLQIVHRHGDRTPLLFFPNDPYKNESKYWDEGMGELTNTGKYRMYKKGQFIREAYNSYLGYKYSPREVYIRSSSADRCIESVSCLLSGAYPPKQKEWQWNNGSDPELGHIWQPFPIQTFIPHSDDLVCSQNEKCPIVDYEYEKIYNRTLLKEFVEQNKELYSNLSKIIGIKHMGIWEAVDLWDTLNLETEHNYIWSKIWTKEEQNNIVKQLSVSNEIGFRYDWDSPLIKRLIAGGLVKELNKNFQSVIEKQNKRKIYIYSTHDSIVAALMHAMNIYNGRSPPFGATLFFELHKKINGSSNNPKDYFVRVFYDNSTLISGGIPHSLTLRDCNNTVDCPLNQYFDSTKYLIYEDFYKECNQKHFY